MELSNRDGKVTVNHPAVTPVSYCLLMCNLPFRDGDGKTTNLFFLWQNHSIPLWDRVNFTQSRKEQSQS